MIDRWTLAIEQWNGDGIRQIEVSVPQGEDGEEIRELLRNAQDRGTRVEWGERIMLHEDGRNYKLAFVSGPGARDVADECIMLQSILPQIISEKEGDAIYHSH